MGKQGLKLRDYLLARSVKEVKSLATVHKVKVTNKMRKEEMVSVIEQTLLDTERLEQLLVILDKDGWQFFQSLAVEDASLEVRLNDQKYAQLFSELGYIRYDRDDPQGTAEMPVEVKCLFKLIEADGFAEFKARADMLHAYSQAAVNLYGMITLEELIDIINRQIEDKTDKAELLLAQRPHLDVNAYYCFWENYLVSISFRDDNFEYVPQFLAEIVGKPRYVPPKEGFLLYIDDDFYERTVHTSRLEKMLIDDYKTPPGSAKSIVAKVVFSIQSGSGMGETIQVLTNHGIVIPEDSLHHVMSQLAEIHNTSRLWINKGYTPNELTKLLGVGPNATVKIRRNDPCPCGSGKKYKKCCGK